MQQTTKVMLAHYMATNFFALDVVWMRRRRLTILNGDFDYAVIKPYYIYSGETAELLKRQQDYPSPLFDSARKHR